MRISLCMIVRDEAKLLGRCLASVKDLVDEIVIVDTGSTDGTIAVAKSFETAACPVVIEHFTWINDFAAARNYSFGFATGDWILWLDADDVVPNATELRALLERLEQESPGAVDVVQLPYHYAHDDVGNVLLLLSRERLLRNNREWTWVERIHEHIDYPAALTVFSDKTHPIIHQTERETGARARDRNIHILRDLIAEAGGMAHASPRHLVYLAEESRLFGDTATMKQAYEAYLTRSGFDEECGQVCCKLARLALQSNDLNQAQHYVQEAMRLLPHWPDAFICSAELCLARTDYKRALAWLDIAAKLPHPDTMLITNPFDYVFVPLRIQSICYTAMGRVEEAREVLHKLGRLRPDETIAQELLSVEAEIQRRKRVNATAILGGALPVTALRMLPDDVRREPLIQRLVYSKLRRQRRSPSVSIYTGPHWESWGAQSVTTGGIGGSETAVVYMAKYLAAAGVDVTVFGEPGPAVDRIDGVLWASHQEFDPNEPVDLFISSRRPDVFDQPINATQRWLWCHDVSLGDSITDKRAEQIDRFLMLSDWQADAYVANYPGVTREKIMRIRNGIEPALMDEAAALEQPKDLRRFIWSSSPDRGLEYLLNMWPEIHALDMSASLHIYYGWDNIDRARGIMPHLGALKQRILRQVELNRGRNVVWHGRAGQRALYSEMLQSGVWCYPTCFHETYCITATEALACGVYPIVSNCGALPETLNGHGTLITGSPAYMDVRAEFIEAIKRFYAGDLRCDTAATVYALSQSWESLATEWATIVRGL